MFEYVSTIFDLLNFSKACSLMLSYCSSGESKRREGPRTTKETSVLNSQTLGVGHVRSPGG